MDREWKGRDRKPFERTTPGIGPKRYNSTPNSRS